MGLGPGTASPCRVIVSLTARSHSWRLGACLASLAVWRPPSVRCRRPRRGCGACGRSTSAPPPPALAPRPGRRPRRTPTRGGLRAPGPHPSSRRSRAMAGLMARPSRSRLTPTGRTTGSRSSAATRWRSAPGASRSRPTGAAGSSRSSAGRPGCAWSAPWPGAGWPTSCSRASTCSTSPRDCAVSGPSPRTDRLRPRCRPSRSPESPIPPTWQGGSKPSRHRPARSSATPARCSRRCRPRRRRRRPSPTS